MSLSEQLLQLRLDQHLTQPEVAAAVGLSLRAYQNYERGLREPKTTVHRRGVFQALIDKRGIIKSGIRVPPVLRADYF